MSEKEKSRRYRERLKADPEKYAERNRKKRESYHKNKKLISSIQPTEQKKCRIIWKLRKRVQRKRLKAVENILAVTPPSSPSILQEVNIPQAQNVPTPPPSPDVSLNHINKERGRKRVRRDRTKLYKENLRLLSEAQMWKKKYEKYKKRAHRKEKEILKIKEKQSKEKNAGIDSKVDHNKYKTLTNTIRERYKKIKTRKEKIILKNIFKDIDLHLKRKKS